MSQTSSPLVFRPFARPFLTGGLGADSRLSFGALLFAGVEVADAGFWFWVARDLVLSGNTRVRRAGYTEDDIMPCWSFRSAVFSWSSGEGFSGGLSAFRRTLIVPLSWPTCFCAHAGRSSWQSLLSTGGRRLASRFGFACGCVGGVLSVGGPDFANCLGQMYPAELEIKDTTESNTSAPFLDLLLSIESDGQLRTSL